VLKVPRHLAIIMDGNGRWAGSRGRERTLGHLRGARVAKKVIEECTERGVQFLTLYAFSTENWLRPLHEVSFLMQLLARHLRRERKTLNANNIRFLCIGDLSRLPETVAAEVQQTIDETKTNTGMTLIFALSYGSRQELTHAAKKLCEKVKAGTLDPEEIQESNLTSCLETAEFPDPDLIIRTSGEYRLSNFLLWQAAYSELYFTDVLWPDFTIEDLNRALYYFSSRERRFGQTHAQPPVEASPPQAAQALK
jgi:undecaprenyl diphosphate synthase